MTVHRQHSLDEHVRSVDQRIVLPPVPLCIWMTGLSGAGKSTIAAALGLQLAQQATAHYLIDGDILREGLNKDLGFSRQDRSESVRRAGEIARLMVDAGIMVVVAMISPFRDDRIKVRERIGADRFVEVFVDTPLEVCEHRDPKGLYRKARGGQLPDFTGIDSAYERPDLPDIHVRYDGRSATEVAGDILAMLSMKAALRRLAR